MGSASLNTVTATEEKIYEQVNENYRFLAKWRQLAFAGHLAVLAGALSFVNLAVERDYSRGFVALCFVLVAGIGVIFWIADRRTYSLAMHAVQAGKKLEGTSGGFFSENLSQDSAGRKWHSSHTMAVRALFLGSAGVFLVAAIIAIAGGIPSRTQTGWEYSIIYGPITNAATPAGTLAAQLDRAITEGWEFVSTGSEPSSGAFMLIRRHKK